jgi:hypothetical protein
MSRRGIWFRTEHRVESATRFKAAEQASQHLHPLRERSIEKCPDRLWNDPADKNKFWHVAYHALFYTHLYLQMEIAEANDVRSQPPSQSRLTLLHGFPQHDNVSTGPAGKLNTWDTRCYMDGQYYS